MIEYKIFVLELKIVLIAEKEYNSINATVNKKIINLIINSVKTKRIK